jgi:pimeloyl-ACP methyl ester carboxylesterase
MRYAAPHEASESNDVSLILFHESPLSSRVWDLVLPESGRFRRVVAPDTPGYGLSDPPPRGDFEIPDYAAALLAALTDAGVGDMVVCGVHTGASIALEAARQSERVRGVILSGVALLTEDERNQYLDSWTPPIPVSSDGEQFRWAVERYHRIWGSGTPGWMLNLAINDLLHIWDRYDWGYRAAFRYDPEPALRELPLPTLLLDPEFDLLAAKDPLVQAMVADCRTEILPGLPGQMHLRAPEETARHLEAFCVQIVSEAR